MVGKPLPQVEDLPIDEAVEKLEARANSAKDMKTSTARLVWATWVLAGDHRRAGPFDRRAYHRHREQIVSRNVRPDELERRLQERLDALPPAARAELLHVLMLPDLERAERIREFWG